MAGPGVLRHAALAAATAAVVAGLLIGGIAGDAFWVTWGLAWVGFPIVAALLLWQRPRHAIGWLLWLTGACWAVTLVAYTYTTVSTVWLEFLGQLTSRMGFLLLVAIVVLFPSGKAQTRATRLLLAVGAVLGGCLVVGLLVDPAPLDITGAISPLAVPALGPATSLLNGPGFAMVPLLMLGAFVSLVGRWRQSQGPERLQYRWFALSVGFAVTVLIVTNTLFNYLAVPIWVYALATALGLNAVPVAIGVAVTRYRLYEIDRIVSRTTSYAAVTGLLLLVYAAVVTTISRLLPGSSSAFAVAAATLAAAAMFRPLLRRVQTAVDHRFNRSGYDAQQAADAFANRLRDEVDPDEVTADLVAVLRTTVQPARVGLWLRESAP